MLRLYGHPVSQPTRAVSWLLAIHAHPHEYIRLSPVEGDTLTPDFLTKFPLACVPAITDESTSGPVHLSEGPAILAYLAETRGWESWFPTNDVVQRAHINSWMSWHHGALRQCTQDCFRPQMLKFMKANKIPFSDSPVLPTQRACGLTKQEQYHFLTQRLTPTLREMIANARWTTENSGDVFLCRGETPTVADLLSYCEVDQLDYIGLLEGIKCELPLFARWVGAMRKLDKHDDVRKPLAKLAAGMKVVLA